MADCFSRFTLVRYALKEFPAPQLAQMAGHIDRCDACRALLAEAQSDFSAYREGWDGHVDQLRHKFRAVDAEEDAEPEAKTRTAGLFSWSRGRVWLAGAAAATALWVAGTVLVQPADPPGRHDVAFKGELTLAIIAKRGEVQRQITEGAAVRGGDALRFVLTSAGPGYLTVFSVDGRGTLTPYYPPTDPQGDAAPLRIPQAGVHELDGSRVLDDAPGEEVILAVFSAHTFSRTVVHARLAPLVRATDAGPLQSAARELRVTLRRVRLAKQR